MGTIIALLLAAGTLLFSIFQAFQKAGTESVQRAEDCIRDLEATVRNLEQRLRECEARTTALVTENIGLMRRLVARSE